MTLRSLSSSFIKKKPFLSLATAFLAVLSHGECVAKPGAPLHSEDVVTLSSASHVVKHAKLQSNSHPHPYFLCGWQNKTISTTREKNEALLRDAAEKGDAKAVMSIMGKLLSVDATDIHGNSALMLAAKNGHNAVVRLLLAGLADRNIQNANGETAMMLAVEKKHLEVLRTLWNWIDRRKKLDFSLIDRQKEGVFQKGVRNLDLPMLASLVRKAGGVNARDDSGYPFLVQAVSLKNKPITMWLLKEGANVRNQAKDGTTALLAAMKAGDWEVAKMFIEFGADVNAKDDVGNMPLVAAVRWGNLEMTRILFAHGATVVGTGVDADGDPLEIQALLRNNDVLAEVLSHGGDVNASDTQEGLPAISVAIRTEDKMGVRLLLDRGADKNLASKNGNTPLHWSCVTGNLEIITWLVDKNNVNARGEDNKTPLMFAAKFGYLEAVRLLLKNGADPRATDTYGQTAAQILEQTDMFSSAENRANKPRILELLAKASQ